GKVEAIQWFTRRAVHGSLVSSQRVVVTLEGFQGDGLFIPCPGITGIVTQRLRVIDQRLVGLAETTQRVAPASPPAAVLAIQPDRTLKLRDRLVVAAQRR